MTTWILLGIVLASGFALGVVVCAYVCMIGEMGRMPEMTPELRAVEDSIIVDAEVAAYRQRMRP